MRSSILPIVFTDARKSKEIWFVRSFAIHAGSPRNSEPQPGENVDQRRAGDLSQIASFYPSISILGRPRLLPASASITYFLNQYRIWNFALFDCCEASWSDFFSNSALVVSFKNELWVGSADQHFRDSRASKSLPLRFWNARIADFEL